LSTAGNRRAVMTMFSDAQCIHCHRVRLVLAEKGIKADIEIVDPDNKPEDLMHLNPANTVPTLVDRDLVLYDARVVVDYLDERYPHPPLMPIDPVSRAKTRLALYRIESDWYSLLPQLEADGAARTKAQGLMSESLTASADVFNAMPFFLSEEHSLLDTTLAPLLWRLPHYGIVLPEAAGSVHQYCKKIFARDGFQASLTEQERTLGL